MSAEPKVVVITGASQGIGAGLVKGFLGRGYRVVANSRKISFCHGDPPTPQYRARHRRGGLGSLACVLLGPDQARAEFAAIRQGTSKPINMNFFCHAVPPIDAAREAAWRQRLRPYFVELGLDPEMPVPASSIVVR